MLHPRPDRFLGLFDEEARPGRSGTKEEGIWATSVEWCGGGGNSSCGTLLGVDGEGVGTEDLLWTPAVFLQGNGEIVDPQEMVGHGKHTHLELFQRLLQALRIPCDDGNVCTVGCEELREGEAQTRRPASHKTMLERIMWW